MVARSDTTTFLTSDSLVSPWRDSRRSIGRTSYTKKFELESFSNEFVRTLTIEQQFETSAKASARDELRKSILLAITRWPGLDDIEIATRIRQVPIVVSRELRAMEADGEVVRG